MSKKIQHCNFTLLQPEVDGNGQAILNSQRDIPLSWQSSDSTLPAFKKGVAEIAALTQTVDEDGLALIEPGVPFAVWCVFTEREPAGERDRTGVRIMGADGKYRVAAASVTVSEADELPFK